MSRFFELAKLALRDGAHSIEEGRGHGVALDIRPVWSDFQDLGRAAKEGEVGTKK